VVKTARPGTAAGARDATFLEPTRLNERHARVLEGRFEPGLIAPQGLRGRRPDKIVPD
jgi:hypothetical protein